MAIYFDASVLLPTIVEESTSASIDRLVKQTVRPLIVGEFAAAEVSSAIWRLVRMKEMTPDDGRARLADFDAWRAAATESVDTREADIRLAHILVRRFDLRLRASDALHLAICRRLSFGLATLDRRLAAAARELDLDVEGLA